MRTGGTARKALLVLLLAVVLLPFGVPRFLNPEDDSSPAGSGDVKFARVCRNHGGTPRILPGTGAGDESQRSCRVRYGRRVYVMDAVTPDGFDTDSAKFQRQGCAEARRRAKAAPGSGDAGEMFIYHPTTGVCEKRPPRDSASE